MNSSIAVIGLGYVGLPLAVALARSNEVVGFDINLARVKELKSGVDRTCEVEGDVLRDSKLVVTSEVNDLKDKDIYIVTVPTPVDDRNKPDLTAMFRASEMVASVMKKGSIVVYESTVFPGVTEDLCGPILEKTSGFVCGQDFFLGYSPERINPGDKVHTVDKITKVVSGQTPEVTQKLVDMYGAVNNKNIFVAANIKTAEAAKVIENAQRDINIAFMNEISVIFDRVGISTYDVLAAAGTKWNFLPFTPGLVGGHCIGVDPYYLAECAKDLGLNAEVILSGRRINDSMGSYVANKINERLVEKQSYGQRARILMLGLTFKENVPDLRNSKVIDVIRRLEDYGHEIVVHDVLANAVEAKQYYGLEIHTDMSMLESVQAQMAVGENQSRGSVLPFDCIVGAVSHEAYTQMEAKQFSHLLKPGGLIADIKNMWPASRIPEGMQYWKM
ncbi:MAG: nucleotide sugar dehydrogenase [Alphaproteobacteria bacterium]|nr:nucleotide sugar dehydrogenase [Alphaproteobacteria bacterium]